MGPALRSRRLRGAQQLRLGDEMRSVSWELVGDPDPPLAQDRSSVSKVVPCLHPCHLVSSHPFPCGLSPLIPLDLRPVQSAFNPTHVCFSRASVPFPALSTPPARTSCSKSYSPSHPMIPSRHSRSPTTSARPAGSTSSSGYGRNRQSPRWCLRQPSAT